MEILRTKVQMRSQSDAWRREGLTLGFVPTMGALHEGHLSLVRLARHHSERVVVSLFVNPAQFAPGEDFDRYPRNESHDLNLCAEAGVDAVFLPSADEMYPPDASVFVEEKRLSEVLCGAARPGHFRGVLTVVLKLFHIVAPDVAVFGRKDAQQLALIERMTRDLDLPVRILPAPIVREPDGLAMSSRNVYLSAEERIRALCLRRSLALAESAFASGRRDAAELRDEIRTLLGSTPGVTVDYVETVGVGTLAPVSTLQPGTLVALAIHIGKTRLIDNTVLGA